MFVNLSEESKNWFFEVLEELSANFNGLSREDRIYLEMKIENNQFLNGNNIKALRNAPLILRLLKEICSWEPENGDDDEFTAKKNELVKLLIIAVR